MTLCQSIQYRIKLFLDKILSFSFLIIFAPVFLLVSIAIKLESPGPVIFKQRRLGKDGEPFTIYKFRTMCDNAIQMGDGIFVSKDDPRITKVGRVLRKTSLDELPQLLNVLRSEMSLVGPRPPLVDHPYSFMEYDEVQKRRFKVLPGITGYAQAYKRNSVEWSDRIEMDVFYKENFSLAFDLKILLVTIYGVLFFKKIYSDNGTKKPKSTSLGEK